MRPTHAGEPMRMSSLLVVLVVSATLCLPSVSMLPSAQASTACTGGSTPVWNHQPLNTWRSFPRFQTTVGRCTKMLTTRMKSPWSRKTLNRLRMNETLLFIRNSDTRTTQPGPYTVLDPLTTGQFARPLKSGTTAPAFCGLTSHSTHRTTFCVSLSQNVTVNINPERRHLPHDVLAVQLLRGGVSNDARRLVVLGQHRRWR